MVSGGGEITLVRLLNEAIIGPNRRPARNKPKAPGERLPVGWSLGNDALHAGTRGGLHHKVP
jgi:hypothetical protein